MTDEDRRKIIELHDALLGVPPGSPEGAEPVLTRVNRMLVTYERGSWALRMTVFLLSAMAGVVVAWETVRKALPW